MDEKAQVSAELIIIIAALMAVAVIFITQLEKTAKTGKAVLSNKTSEVFDEIKDIK